MPHRFHLMIISATAVSSTAPSPRHTTGRSTSQASMCVGRPVKGALDYRNQKKPGLGSNGCGLGFL